MKRRRHPRSCRRLLPQCNPSAGPSLPRDRPARPQRPQLRGTAPRDRRRRVRPVNRPRRGLLVDPPPAVLEPSDAQAGGQAPEPALAGGPATAPGSPVGADEGRVPGASDELARWLQDRGQDRPVETLYRDWDDFTTFHDFPAEHWIHLAHQQRDRVGLRRREIGRPSPNGPGSVRTRSISCSRSSSASVVTGGSSTLGRRS